MLSLLPEHGHKKVLQSLPRYHLSSGHKFHASRDYISRGCCERLVTESAKLLTTDDLQLISALGESIVSLFTNRGGVRDLDEQYLKSYLHKKMLLSPELPPKYGYENHPLGIEESSYKDISGVPAKVIDFVDPKSHDNEDDKDCGFMKGPEMFMVTDTLNVSPISAILGMSIPREMNVPVTDVEVRVAHVGAEEAFRLLVASFVCDAALTSAFLAREKRDGEL